MTKGLFSQHHMSPCKTAVLPTLETKAAVDYAVGRYASSIEQCGIDWQNICFTNRQFFLAFETTRGAWTRGCSELHLANTASNCPYDILTLWPLLSHVKDAETSWTQVCDHYVCRCINDEERTDVLQSNDEVPGIQSIVPISNTVFPELFPMIEVTPQVLLLIRYIQYIHDPDSAWFCPYPRRQ